MIYSQAAATAEEQEVSEAAEEEAPTPVRRSRRQGSQVGSRTMLIQADLMHCPATLECFCCGQNVEGALSESD